MGRIVVFAITILAAAMVVGLSRGATALSWKPEETSNPAAPGSLAPGVYGAPNDSIILAWIEPSGSAKALRFAFWKSGSWTAPVTVIRSADLQPDSAAPPAVVKLQNGPLVAVWSRLIKSPGNEDGNFLFASASTDFGQHWSTPARIHSDTGVSEHSYDSIAATSPDEATIIWLDSRDYDAKHRYRLMSVVINSEGILSDEKTIDEDTCTCCPTAFASTPKLALAAYRGHNPQQIRDIKVARLTAGNWRTPLTVHDDLWKINGCPVNGPALSINGNRVAVLWFTASNDEPQIKIAMSDDLGSTFRPPVTLDSPKDENRPVGHVAMSLRDDGSAVAVWLRHCASGAEIVGESVSVTGQQSGYFTIASGTESGLGYPRLQKAGDHLMVSWSGNTGHDVKTAIIRGAKD